MSWESIERQLWELIQSLSPSIPSVNKTHVSELPSPVPLLASVPSGQQGQEGTSTKPPAPSVALAHVSSSRD